MAATDIQGSWFPSGYYGHFRSKSRADFVCEYRQLARPIPPKKFIARSTEPTRRHVFSHHDNREAFLNDALIFQQGLGRRRVPNSTYHFKNDFMAWMPEREYVEKTQRPLASTYKQDFAQSKKQLFIERPKTSFEGVPTTSYRYAHGSGAPNRYAIDAMNNEALKLSLLNRKDRAMTAVNKGRESVASCLTWVSAKPKPVQSDLTSSRPVVPPATQTTMFLPHPPSSPKSQMVQEAWPVPQSSPPVQQQAESSAPVTSQAAE
ncbi:uncharacterized protein LOC127882425 [Dreissena polymorpha]|uniref:Domain of unknown function with conserved HDNR motif domain-containing protein n=1 Tax=Dreissena polymorpha TaxID=45954 RepID=A0A9D4GLD1_DREPO|nr:uncharacterized protein LOC127882425 [Dreissena polymorpha]KAH3819145.1 hypothetical protein DPMN_120878 [Dreissena polymorpha]